MDKILLINEFKKKFQQEATNLFFAPGRINLIGEHTDYYIWNVCDLQKT
jgi:galactokinase